MQHKDGNHKQRGESKVEWLPSLGYRKMSQHRVPRVEPVPAWQERETK